MTLDTQRPHNHRFRNQRGHRTRARIPRKGDRQNHVDGMVQRNIFILEPGPQMTLIIPVVMTSCIWSLQLLSTSTKIVWKLERSMDVWIALLSHPHNLRAKIQSKKRWLVDSAAWPQRLQTETTTHPWAQRFLSAGILWCKIQIQLNNHLESN